MPIVRFESLPDDARLWVFAASDAVTDERAALLLNAVDEWLDQWTAHGEPLVCGRQWRDDRFLAIAVDQAAAGASGCSIDALFRVLQGLQSRIGTSMLGGTRVFHRQARGEVAACSRADLARRLASGEVSLDTPVFDTTVTTAAAYRRGFERPLRDSWHRDLAPLPAPGVSHQSVTGART